jgi:GH25 family lysozyme M1 (1,4-beta-N-acetylmuramidase)
VTVWGWDASDFDWSRGSMDLTAAARDGIQLFTHKATESTGIKHLRYGEALNRARAAGIELLGAYHVVRSTDVSAQVRHFLGYLDVATPWWGRHPGFFLQVDLELWDYDHVSAATGKAFVAELRRRTDKLVVLYASRGQYGDSLDGIDVPLWNANYGANQAGTYRELYPGDGSSRWAPYSGRAPMLLQFGSRATIGSQPGCDINAFRGTYEQLKALIEGDDVALSDDERAALFEVRDRLRWVDGRAAALADGTDTYVDPAGEAHPAALVKLVRDLAGGVQALSTRVESMAVGDVDYAALARAVADEQARRLES